MRAVRVDDTDVFFVLHKLRIRSGNDAFGGDSGARLFVVYRANGFDVAIRFEALSDHDVEVARRARNALGFDRLTLRRRDARVQATGAETVRLGNARRRGVVGFGVVIFRALRNDANVVLIDRRAVVVGGTARVVISVVATPDVVAADRAGIAGGFRRARGAAAIGVDSVGEGARSPFEGGDRGASGAVDHGAETAGRAGIAGVAESEGSARGGAGRLARRERQVAGRGAGRGRQIAGRGARGRGGNVARGGAGVLRERLGRERQGAQRRGHNNG